MIDGKDNDDWTALMHLAWDLRTELGLSMTQKGSKPKSETIDRAKIFTNNPLLGSLFPGYAETMKFLLTKGANIEEKDDVGYTALMLAIVANNPVTVDFLIKNKANVNAESYYGR